MNVGGRCANLRDNPAIVLGDGDAVASDGRKVVEDRTSVGDVASTVLGKCAIDGEDRAKVAQK